MYSQDDFVCDYHTSNIILHKLTSFVILSLCYPLGIINLVGHAMIYHIDLLEDYILKWTSPKNTPETNTTAKQEEKTTMNERS